jgi:hypothetical protein
VRRSLSLPHFTSNPSLADNSSSSSSSFTYSPIAR